MKKRADIKLELTRFVSLAILGYLIFFFTNEIYKLNLITSIILALVSACFFFYAWKKSFFGFLMLSLFSISLYLSIAISFDISIYLNYFISLVYGLLLTHTYEKWKNKDKYGWLMLLGFCIVWGVLAFNVSYRNEWIIENLLTIPFVVLLLVVSRWFRMSKITYSLIYLYMFLHIIGSHYTYAEVPFGFWLENFLGITRNHYDRIVHFSFGFLLAYPVREVFVRVGKYKGIWALFAPILFVFGMSAFYEILEWWVALVFGGDLGVAYLGTQGDVWDAQKDIFLAGIGSILAMMITFITIMTFNAKNYWKELKESFKVDRRILGEVAIERMGK